MLMVNLGIIIIFLMLALISRKHFSKYKNIVKAMSYSVFLIIKKHLDFSKKKTDLRKVNVVSDSKLMEICRLYYTNVISICMVIIFVINLACMLTAVKKQFNSDDISNVIERGEYDDGVTVTKVYVGDQGEQKEYELSVYPRQYTVDEFYAEADEVFSGLKNDILVNNADLDHIDSNLNLPSSDKYGRFNISWESDYPEYILPSGKVSLEELRQETKVNLVARIEYLDYVAEKSYSLTLIPDKKSEELSDAVGVVLEQIEHDSRNDASFEIPETIEGKRISLYKMDNRLYEQLLFFGIIMCTITIVFSKGVLEKKKKRRDDMLIFLYPSFVNRISILIGAGMNIRNCFINIISKSDKNILTEELEYTVNQIKSGYDEAASYDELGIRIGLPQYSRLMGHISQNIRMGTKDLRMIMADEVKEAMEERKENTKKKGEKASTKLLFPMIMLMAVVIVIIMLPAFVGL